MLVAAAVVSVALMNALAAEPAATPSYADIVANVSKATTPDKEYQVEVTQTIVRGNAAPTDQPLKSAYTVSWTAATGFSTAKPVVQADGKDGANASPAPSVQVQIDLLRSLKELQKWKDVAVAAEQVDGHAGLRISAKGQVEGMTSQIWVDAERWVITRIIVTMGDKNIIDGAFEHRHVNDAYWLLSKANMKQETDGTVIFQDYGAYSIEKK